MNHEELIEKYFAKSLNADEKSMFDQLMQNNQPFREQVVYEEDVKKAITLNERQALKKKLQSFETKKTKRNYTVWYAAASFAVMLGIGFWTFSNDVDTNAVYEEYYQSYPNVVAPTVRGENSTDIKSEAFYSYDSGDYTKALTLFSKLYDTEKEDYSLFYKSLSLMELKRYDEALTSFEQFDLQKNNGFTPYVKWYKALTLVKLKQEEKALVLLQELANSTNPMQKMAKELVTELE
jgi:tetratricopeptide (TPR) repeat protein